MKLTAKPVAAAHASKITRAANPNVAQHRDVAHAPACATATGEAISTPWAVSRGATTFPCVTVLSSRGAVVAMALPKLPHYEIRCSLMEDMDDHT